MSNNKKPKIQLLKLNPHSKKLFLEHVAKYWLGNSETRLNFNSFMLISKQYLNTCQFLLKFTIMGIQCKDKKFKVRFLPYQNFHRISLTNQEMSFDEILKRQKLLNLKYFEIHYDNKRTEEFEEIFNGLKGTKISLHIEDEYQKSVEKLEEEKLLVQNLHEKLYQLDWKIEHLLDPKIPSLNLESCIGNAWVKFDQLKQILTKHSIKNLELNIKNDSPNFEEIDSSHFDSFPNCFKLQKLSIYVLADKTSKIFELIMKALNFMPNLKKLEIFICVDLHDEENAEKFKQIVFETLEKAREIQRNYGHLQKIKLRSEFEGRLEKYQETVDKIAEKLKETIPWTDENDPEYNCIKSDCDFPYSYTLDDYDWKEGKIGFKLKVEVTKDRDEFSNIDSDEEQENEDEDEEE